MKKNEKEGESLPRRRLLWRWTSAKGWPPRNDYPIFPASVCSLFLCLVCLSVSVFLFFLFLPPWVLSVYSLFSVSPPLCSFLLSFSVPSCLFSCSIFFSLFRSTLPRSPCISLLQCPVPGAEAAKDGALELLLKTKYNGLTLCFPLLSFFLVLPPPLFSWLSLLSLRPFLSFVFFPQRPFSSFYKAREGHVSLPPETAGIVEARDRGLQKRHRGYSGRDLLDFPLAMICWIFPCCTGLRQTDDEQ